MAEVKENKNSSAEREHSTGDEIRYIDTLGTRKTLFESAGWPRRIKLLKGWLESAKHRVKWGNIDKEAAIKYAAEALEFALIARDNRQVFKTVTTHNGLEIVICNQP